MNDLADRIEAFIPDGDGYNSEYAHTLQDAVDKIRLAGWVPVSERTPEPSKKVVLLAYLPKHGICLIHRRLNKWEFLDGDTCASKVTHWMPLPAAPATGEE